MRFKASIRNIHTFTRKSVTISDFRLYPANTLVWLFANQTFEVGETLMAFLISLGLTSCLALLGKDVWIQLNDEQLRFTVVPEQGSQVWAVLSIDAIFDAYTIQSASANNVINLRASLSLLNRALRTALAATSVSIRLTKRDNIPLLALTVVTAVVAPQHRLASSNNHGHGHDGDSSAFADQETRVLQAKFGQSDRETVITQDVPVRVLPPDEVALIHEPVAPQPDVHVILPSLAALKAISDRFTRLCLTTSSSSNSNLINKIDKPEFRGYRGPENSQGLNEYGMSEAATDSAMDRLVTSAGANNSPRITLSANATGSLKMSISTPFLSISSVWTNLVNPELDPNVVEGGTQGVRDHASTKMQERAAQGEDAWASVIVEGRDWSRVLGVGRMGGRVVACFCNHVGIVLYVYLDGHGDGSTTDDTESVLTYYIASYSA